MEPRSVVTLVVALFAIVPLMHAQSPAPKKSPQRATVTELDLRTGKQKKVGTFTFDQIWKRTVDQRIAAELAHQRPDFTMVTSWKQEWQQWYATLRSKKGVGWNPSEFKSSEDMVRYIKQKRRAKGLPIYDP
jgi:hypothetical protein